MLLIYMMQCSDTRRQCAGNGSLYEYRCDTVSCVGDNAARNNNPQEGQSGENAFASCEPRCYAWGTIHYLLLHSRTSLRSHRSASS